MAYIQILSLVAIMFVMQTIGVAYIQRKEILQKKTVLYRIRRLFPMTAKFMMFYSISIIVGVALVLSLVFQYPDKTIFIQKVRMMVLFGLLCPIAQIDYRIQKIPNKLLIVACVVWVFTIMFELVYYTEGVFRNVKDSLVAASVVFVICIICKLLIKNGIGMGDIKLFMVMGLLQGTTGMSGSVFMSMIVAFWGSVVMLLIKKKTRKDNISFGPFILIGTTISMFLAGV